MIILITLLLCFGSIFLGHKLLGKWFNHISIYSLNWTMFIVLYEFRLMNYSIITVHTWMVILFAFVGFILGVLTISFAKQSLGQSTELFKTERKIDFVIFQDNCKLLKRITYITAIIGLIGTIYYWMILINKFGNIAAVLAHGNIVYTMRTKGEIVGGIPYLDSLSFVAIASSAIFTAYKNKLTLIPILPFLGVVLQGIALVGRGGILLALFLFIIMFFLTRHLLNLDKRFRKKDKTNTIIAVVVLLLITITALVGIKVSRGTIENFKASSSSLKKYENSMFISPSIYLYASSDIVVLSKYFEKEMEHPRFGENTFAPIYGILARIKVVEPPDWFQRGYNVPMWSNTATYLREIHADFGYIGLALFPYLLGLVTTFFWFKLYQNLSIIYLLPLSYLMVIISYSTIMMITRLAIWAISLVILIAIFHFFEKAKNKKLFSKSEL